MTDTIFYIAISIVLFVSLVMTIWALWMMYRLWKGRDDVIILHNAIVKQDTDEYILTEADLVEIRDRYGAEVENVVRELIRNNERWMDD